jgi:AraC-like DNA-binding protein
VAGNTSFNELVGRLRVEEAQRLLLDPSNAGVAVEPLGMEAGFRSRSAFYAAFRGQTGLSPAEFRKQGGLSRPAR